MSAVSPNVLTVDVEEWFHICGVGGPLAPDNWPSLPSRVVDTTDRLLDLFDRAGVGRTFFVLGYVAERHPQLVERIAEAGHEIGSHGHMHARVYDLNPATLRRGPGSESRRTLSLRRSLAWSDSARRSGRSTTDRSGRSTCSRARGSVSIRAWRRCGSSGTLSTRKPHHRSTEHGTIMEFPPAVVTRFGYEMPFGGGWGLRMSRPAFRAAGARRAGTRRPDERVLGAPLGNRR